MPDYPPVHMVFGSSSLRVGPMVLRSFTRVLAFVGLTVLSYFPARSWAQAAAQTPPAQSTYTFRADTHIVLTDVTVTDAKGNPVHGLPQTAFRIFDNNKPQEIASFEEHADDACRYDMRLRLPLGPAPTAMTIFCTCRRS